MVSVYCPNCKQSQELVVDPIATMQGTWRRLSYLVRGLSPDDLMRRPSRQDWSMSEVLWHLADVEIVFSYRFRAMLGEDNPVLLGYDQDAWTQNLNYRARPIMAAIALFRALRKANVDLLSAVPGPAWERSGRHSENGTITVGSYVQHTCHHDRLHLDQVRATRLAVCNGK
ncbi:MAG: DinB family protein [Chloroflexi bacterium]|nr:DinB family protein [Chloroflexota bacterium]